MPLPEKPTQQGRVTNRYGGESGPVGGAPRLVEFPDGHYETEDQVRGAPRDEEIAERVRLDPDRVRDVLDARDDQNDDVETLAEARGVKTAGMAQVTVVDNTLLPTRDEATTLLRWLNGTTPVTWPEDVADGRLLDKARVKLARLAGEPGANSAAYPKPSDSGAAPKGEQEGLRLACDALAALVREEFPSDHSLTDIASTWSLPEISEEHVEALRAYETGEPLASPNPNPVSPLPDRLTPEERDFLDWHKRLKTVGHPIPLALTAIADRLLARLADREPE